MDGISRKVQVISLISDITGIDESQINESTNIVTDLGMDSLERLNLLCEIEEIFKVYVDFDRGLQWMTVSDIIEELVELDITAKQEK